MDVPELLRTMPLSVAALLFLAENLFIVGAALVIGEWGTRRFVVHRIAPPPPPLSAREVRLATVTVLLNTLVTFVGLLLFRHGWIVYRDDVGLRALLDIPILLMVMDFAMYLLHRLAHHPWLFPWLHATHHEYTAPRPLTLFVLNPAEALAFGGLWLLLCCSYAASWLGMSVYLVLNVASGLIGHLGVEPMPAAWVRHPLGAQLGSATFHAQHHAELHANFGFYTVIWDRCFGTLAPTYDARLREAADRRPVEITL